MSDLEESSDGSIFDEPYVPPTREQPKQQEAQFDNDAAYRAQFDRSSSQFHQGDSTLVPTGGSRVPDHMKDHSNWRSLPEVDMKPVDPNEFGPEYAAVFNKREEYNHLKKVVNGVLPHIAALVKNRASLEILKSEERREAIQKLIESNTAKHLEALKDFSVQMKKWEGSPYVFVKFSCHCWLLTL